MPWVHAIEPARSPFHGPGAEIIFSPSTGMLGSGSSRMQSDGTSKRESPVPAYLAGPALVFVVGFCDWWTGPDISIALFYLIPTAFVAWRAGRVPGIFTGVA